MRVLFVIPALAAVYGGPSEVAIATVAALSRNAVFVDLVTTNSDGAVNVTKEALEFWLDTTPGYRLKYFRRIGRAEYKFSISMLIWLWNHIRDYDAVVVASNFNFPVLAAALACRTKGVPYILAPHGMLEPWALAHKAWKKRIYYGLIERPLVLNGASAIQALNQSEAENIRKLRLGPPVVIVPNGIDPTGGDRVSESDAEMFFSRFPETRGKDLVLFLHRIDPKKGLDLLARAFALILARSTAAHLVIAGPDNVNFTETVRGYFAEAGVNAEAVTFTGMLEGPLKRGAVAAAKVFVLPSYSEGFSMAVLEAMAAELPCVITTACNFPEAGAAGAAKVVPVEAGPLAEAIIALLASPEQAAAMGQRARTLVLKEYTWDSVAERLVTILETRVVRRKYG